MGPVRKSRVSKNATAAQLKRLKENADLCITSREHSNELLNVISTCLVDDPSLVCAAMKCIYKIFSCLIQEGRLHLENLHLCDTKSTVFDIQEQYGLWLQECYKDALSQLTDLLHHESVQVQKVALRTLMNLAVSEGSYSCDSSNEGKICFPLHILKDVIGKFLSADVIMACLICRFQDYLKFTDVKFHTIKILSSLLKHYTKNPPGNVTDTFLHNLFSLLSRIKLKSKTDLEKDLKEENPNISLIPSENGTSLFMPNLSQQQKMFSSMWLDSLKFKLPSSLYKTVLISLHDQVIPHLIKPLLLTDFLTESYNAGGAVSLLSLNSLYILIKKYNLEYPDFYKKLYSLLELEVFSVRYRARFFYLTDLFLTSTHLPAYLVAAFAKRLARLALVAPIHILPVLITFIGNLLIRHPSLQVMIHRPDGPQDMSSDPYVMEEADPLRSRAIDSCLWELKTLQSHWHPDISTRAKFINGPLPSLEWDCSDLFDLETSQILKEWKMTCDKVPLKHEMPTGLFECKEDKMKTVWFV